MKAQNPEKGVISGIPHSDASWRRDAICSAALKSSLALSSHQPGGASASRRGGSTGPLGVKSAVGRKGKYSL